MGQMSQGTQTLLPNPNPMVSLFKQVNFLQHSTKIQDQLALTEEPNELFDNEEFQTKLKEAIKRLETTAKLKKLTC